MAESVILVHGIWMTGREMALLGRRLRACGFRVFRFAYPSVRHGLAQNAQRLQHFLESVPGESVHFVAHSLGGLLVRRLFHDFPEQRPGRVVTLGTPHSGCRIAQRIYVQRFSRWLLGQSAEGGLLGGVPAWEGKRELGVIAGSLPVGVGVFFLRLPPPHDGTVTVEETRLPGMADHITLPVSHLGLVFSAEAARHTCHFLHHGRFAPVSRV